ncbi:MAG TPA: Cys-tRNA(Pro) deacylase [Selenomonadales bacterium]|nr:Cys-tRNA(Pro) deacylase [Selenomonadales bacterium]
MPVKTNAARILDGFAIRYRLQEYAVDEHDLSAETVAAKVGMPPEQVFKTLVARGDKTGVLLACIPGSEELDLKALATVSRNKKVEMVPLKDVQPLTGYIRGGVSPVGTKKRYPVFFDESILLWETVAVSAGTRGCQVILAPSELIRAVAGVTGGIVRPKPE